MSDTKLPTGPVMSTESLVLTVQAVYQAACELGPIRNALEELEQHPEAAKVINILRVVQGRIGAIETDLINLGAKLKGAPTA